MVHVVEVYENVILLESFLSQNECDSLIGMTEKIGYSDALIISDGKQILAKEIRNNKRVILDDHDLAMKLWSKVATYLPDKMDGCNPVGLNERFRFYRYEPNQMFRYIRISRIVEKGKKVNYRL